MEYSLFDGIQNVYDDVQPRAARNLRFTLGVWYNPPVMFRVQVWYGCNSQIRCRIVYPEKLCWKLNDGGL